MNNRGNKHLPRFTSAFTKRPTKGRQRPPVKAGKK
jgi:hypothetical protein